MAISFVGAGSGTLVTTGSGTVSKTGCTAGNLLVVHLVAAGTTEDWSAFSSETNITDIDGTPNNLAGITTGQGIGNPSTYMGSLFTGRVTSDGTCSASASVGASGEDLLMRMYEFSGVTSASTIADVFEQDPGPSTSGLGTGTTVDPTQFGSNYITNGQDRLALCFIALATNQAIGDLTGETAGIDFTEAVTEYQEVGPSTGTLQLQTAAIASAGTYDPGTVTIGTSDDWGGIITSLIPALTAPRLRVTQSNMRW